MKTENNLIISRESYEKKSRYHKIKEFFTCHKKNYIIFENESTSKREDEEEKY